MAHIHNLFELHVRQTLRERDLVTFTINSNTFTGTVNPTYIGFPNNYNQVVFTELGFSRERILDTCRHFYGGAEFMDPDCRWPEPRNMTYEARLAALTRVVEYLYTVIENPRKQVILQIGDRHEVLY